MNAHMGNAEMIEASCHCRAISLEIDAPPAEVTECNCSICRRYGVLWAYYSPRHVRLVPPDALTDVYMWDDRAIEFHRCRTCGCVSHWAPVDRQHDRMGINARLLAPEFLTLARVRHLDGAHTERYVD
jgi:hypothetical protein